MALLSQIALLSSAAAAVLAFAMVVIEYCCYCVAAAVLILLVLLCFSMAFVFSCGARDWCVFSTFVEVLWSLLLLLEGMAADLLELALVLVFVL